MAELVLTEFDEAIYRQLQDRARGHGRSPGEEAKAILAEVMSDKNANVWEPVDAIFNRLAASGKTFSDSAELLREDRNR